GQLDGALAASGEERGDSVIVHHQDLALAEGGVGDPGAGAERLSRAAALVLVAGGAVGAQRSAVVRALRGGGRTGRPRRREPGLGPIGEPPLLLLAGLLLGASHPPQARVAVPAGGGGVLAEVGEEDAGASQGRGGVAHHRVQSGPILPAPLLVAEGGGG